MKLSRLLLLAGAGAALGYWLTRTEKGNQIRKTISDRAGDWMDKMRHLRNESANYAEDFLEDAAGIAKSARAKADGQLA